MTYEILWLFFRQVKYCFFQQLTKLHRDFICFGVCLSSNDDLSYLPYKVIRPSVHNGQLFSLIQVSQNCPIDFKLCMMIRVVVIFYLSSFDFQFWLQKVSLPPPPFVVRKQCVFLLTAGVNVRLLYKDNYIQKLFFSFLS